MVARVIALSAEVLGPDAILNWIRACPAGSLRDQTILAATNGLRRSVVYQKRKVSDAELPQAWVDELTSYILAFKDHEMRRRGCRALYLMVKYTAAQLPQKVTEEYDRLWRDVESKLKDSERDTEVSNFIRLFPKSTQHAEIARALKSGGPQRCAYLLGLSSLSEGEKRDWCLQLLADARKLMDEQQKARALSGVGGALWSVHLEEALPVLWESLTLARDLGLKPLPFGDTTGPGYNGWYYPPTNADEALGLIHVHYVLWERPNPSGIWKFASKLNDRDDREAVLQALGGLFVERKEYSKATGLAFLLTSPRRRAWLFADIAAAQCGKSLPF